MNLKEKLLAEGKVRWLDIGSAENFEEGFFYLDKLPLESFKTEKIRNVSKKYGDKYFEMDIANLKDAEFKKLGIFDYIRMQHTFEHLTYEDGQKALRNCAKLLNKGGIISISVPDLRIHIQRYLKSDYKKWNGFKWWALKRIPVNAPNSYYFSIFVYSMPWEEHKWCYDYEGLEFQLKKTRMFKDIRELKLSDAMANVPFTHNRPEEDVCAFAIKK